MPIRIGANFLGLRPALRTQLVRHALAFGFHALVDLRQHLLGQFDPPQADLDDLDPDLLRVRIGACSRGRHDLVTLGGDRLVDRALVDFLG